MSFLGKSYIAEATDVQTIPSGGIDGLLPGMTVTPVPGNYLVFFSCTIEGTVGAVFNDIVIRVGGSNVAASRRDFTTGAAGENQAVPSTMARVTVNGSQAIEAYGSAAGGSSVISYRQLLVVQSG
jgi:hypothetical protein